MAAPTMPIALPFVKATYWLIFDQETDLAGKDCESSIFTHLFCAYAQINSKTYQVDFTTLNQTQFSNFSVSALAKNKDVQFLLSIGGKKAELSVFHSMTSNKNNRKVFIDSSIDIARRYGFHGLDLAWEYPSNPVEMANLKKLVEEWRVAVQEDSDSRYLPALLLTAAVYYSPVYDNLYQYPVQALADNLDFVNIMAYDFYSPGSSEVTGPPAALYDPTGHGPCGDLGLSKWIDAKLPKQKAVFGFPYYGWAWALTDPKKIGYGAPTDGAAQTADGLMTYDMIKDYIVNSGAATYYDAEVIGYKCCAGNTWIGYDDNQSVVFKVKYAKQEGLLGYFSWHVEADIQLGLSRAASLAWDTTDITTQK